MKILTGQSLIFLSVLSIGCAHTPVETINEDKYLGYQPIEPKPALKVKILDKQTKRVKSVYWSDLVDVKKRELLPLQSAHVSVRKSDINGKLSYLGSSVSTAKGKYEVTMDYMKYRVEDVLDGYNEFIGTRRIGIGLRITASVTTKKSDLNLANLAAIGLEASKGNLEGGLSVDVIGIDSESVTNLIPLTTEIDQTAIQASLQALASIKTKMWDEKTTITPHLIAIKQNKPDTANIIRVGYFHSESKKILTEFWMPDGKNVNKSNLKKLKGWMENNGLSTAPGMITRFVNDEAFEALRQKAVKDLKIG